jgi:hypothetical protein
VQVLTPKGPDPVYGICGGYAESDLFLVNFFPGLETPVIERLWYLDTGLIAPGEWEGLDTRRRS